MAEKVKIIPASNDVMFKALFVKKDGDYKLLRSFLSAALSIPKSEIVNILIRNPELVPLYYEGKLVRLDIMLTTTKHVINIEMQVASEDYYKERSLLYCARMYHEELKEGEDYGKTQPCIGIHILNFTMFPDAKEYHSSFSMREDTRHERLTDRMQLHFLELPKVLNVSEKNKPDDSDELRLWMQLFKAKTEEELDMLSNTSVEAIRDSVTAIRALSADEQIREYVRQREKALQDYYSDIAVAETRGIEKGKIEGAAEEKISLAINLIRMGMGTLEKIAEATGLPLSKVQELAAQNPV